MKAVKRLVNVRSTGFMVLFLSFSNVISNILTVVSGILVARWILPEELGKFNVFTLMASYLVLVQLGIPSALGRELPYYFGLGERDEGYRYAAVSQYWQKLWGMASLTLGAVVGGMFWVVGQPEYAMGSFTVGVTTWQILYVTKYLKVLYRTNQDFNKLSTIKIISSLFVFCSIVFVWLYGFYGLCLRAILSALVDFFLAYRWRPIRVKARWEVPYFRRMMKTGLPMFAVANIYGLWPVVQRTVVVALGGPKALGLFSLAFMAEHAMVTVSSAINNVVYPKMATLWGKGVSVGVIIKEVSKPVLMSMALLLVVLPIGWYLLPMFVAYYIPNYSEGVYAAQWMLIVGLIEPLSAYSNIYNVMRKQRQRLIMYVTGIFVWAVVVFGHYMMAGFSLIIFPVAMIFAFIAMTLLNWLFVRNVWTEKAQTDA